MWAVKDATYYQGCLTVAMAIVVGLVAHTSWGLTILPPLPVWWGGLSRFDVAGSWARSWPGSSGVVSVTPIRRGCRITVNGTRPIAVPPCALGYRGHDTNSLR